VVVVVVDDGGRAVVVVVVVAADEVVTVLDVGGVVTGETLDVVPQAAITPMTAVATVVLQATARTHTFIGPSCSGHGPHR